MKLSKEIGRISEYEERALLLFKKNTYEGAYSEYKLQAADFIGRFSEQGFDAEDAANQFILFFENNLSLYTGIKKFQKKRALYHHNLYMVCYVLPYFLELDGVYKGFAQMLVQKWNSTFQHCNIQEASFSEVSAGFVNKLFGAYIL